MPETLEQVLADARGEKSSRAGFPALRLENGGVFAISRSRNAENPTSRGGKVENPTNGNFAPRMMAGMTPNVSTPCVLYFLADPRFPRRPRYVGITENAAARAKTHASTARANDHLSAWKREIRAAGLAPVLHVIARFASREDARAAEWRLIGRWRRRGLCDCNAMHDGAAERWTLRWAGVHARRMEATA